MTTSEPRRPSVTAPERARITDKRQKTQLIGVRVTPAEHAELVGRAAESNCSVPEYLRRCAFVVKLLDSMEVSHG